MTASLGAYMQVYRNDGKAGFALENFRRHYPDSPIYLVSDKGDDFGEVAKRYGCCYEHSSTNVGVRRGGYTVGEMMEWLGRMERCFRFCDTDFVLYMEDDVYVRGRIEIDVGCPLAGLMANPIPDKVMGYLAKRYPNGLFNSQMYGACGGTLYDRKVFLGLVDRLHNFARDDTMEIRHNLWNKASYLDCAICLMYMCLGQGYWRNESLVEPARDAGWESSGKPIVHLAADKLQRKVMGRG